MSCVNKNCAAIALAVALNFDLSHALEPLVPGRSTSFDETDINIKAFFDGQKDLFDGQKGHSAKLDEILNVLNAIKEQGGGMAALSSSDPSSESDDVELFKSDKANSFLGPDSTTEQSQTKSSDLGATATASQISKNTLKFIGQTLAQGLVYTVALFLALAAVIYFVAIPLLDQLIQDKMKPVTDIFGEDGQFVELKGKVDAVSKFFDADGEFEQLRGNVQGVAKYFSPNGKFDQLSNKVDTVSQNVDGVTDKVSQLTAFKNPLVNKDGKTDNGVEVETGFKNPLKGKIMGKGKDNGNSD